MHFKTSRPAANTPDLQAAHQIKQYCKYKHHKNMVKKSNKQMCKDTVCHDVYIQGLEVSHGKVLLKFFPQVSKSIETVGHQDVLRRKS